ncbi:MAG: MBOAT family protein [Opitutales bacterium]|nr:MBOAT family protein [Opitutales bacterium]
MLFSSTEFIFAFFPIVFFGYYLIANRIGAVVSRSFLVAASLFFYAWWKPIYLPLILASIAVNYLIGRQLVSGPKDSIKKNKTMLIVGICFNLGLLGYFKYSWFIVETVAIVTGSGFRIEPLLLPLAISFFTFQQIAFLTDAYAGKVKDFRFSTYALFVSFFPQLIAGPIVHHSEMMPQFEANRRKWPAWENLQQGLQIFIIGLAKKLVIADTLAVYADQGWSDVSQLSFWGAWATSLCYTFQLYFDFSGYSDMAIGCAKAFGINLPINFNSPYKARNIQDFWARWHMTLSRWLRDYLYIPLGGNRKGEARTYRNLFIVFLLGGIWHGAGWTFIVWGVLHGVGSMFFRVWQKMKMPMPSVVAWLITFIYAHIGWVFFRAPNVSEGWSMLKRLFAVDVGISLQSLIRWCESFVDGEWLLRQGGGYFPTHVGVYLIVTAAVAFFAKNSIELAIKSKPRRPVLSGIFYAFVAFVSLIISIRATESPFLYFNF